MAIQNSMATVNFLYRSTKDKSFLIARLLYRYNDVDYVFGTKTKFLVTKHYWTKQHKQLRPKEIGIANEQTKVNSELNKIENHILNAFNATNPQLINKKWLETQIEYYYNPVNELNEIPTELTKFIDYYIDYRKHELKRSSIQKFEVIKKKMEELQEMQHRPILIKDVNDRFKNLFIDFYKTKNYAQNTIQRELSFIKTFCRHARFLGLETSPQLDNLRAEKAKSEKTYLTFDDLSKIEAIDKDKLTESLDNAKDWLIISCYTGQRVSDFMRFSRDMIRIEQGKHLIEFTQKKTGKIMTVPLHNKVLEILEKRGGNFPYPISDQKYNDFIKTVCEKAKLSEVIRGSRHKEMKPNSNIYRKESGNYAKWELVTSHIGRRSFATNFYGIIPTSYLIYVTGHSTEAMFLNYIGKSNKDIAMELTNYF